MNKKSLMDEQRELVQKYLNGFKLDYYEVLIVYGVFNVMCEALRRKIVDYSIESEVES